MSKNKKNQRRNIKRKEISNKVQEYKADKGCKLCQEKHPACLTFHHVDPTIKTNTVSNFIRNRRTEEAIFEEIEKCEVMCLNCHAKLHYDEDCDGP